MTKLTDSIRFLSGLTFCILLSFSASASQKPLIILDPGHGGEDTGTIQIYHHGKTNEKVFEKNIALTIADKTKASLQRLGFEVLLTRKEDKFTDLDERTKIARQLVAKYPNRYISFVSIHLNSDKNLSSQGIEAYVFNATTNDASVKMAEIENGSKRVAQHGILNLIFADLSASGNYLDSVNLACSLTTSLSQGSFFRNRGVRQGLFFVLMDSTLPSVILEIGFMSSPKELEKLLNPLFQNSIASRIALSIQSEHHRQTRIKRSSLAMSGIKKAACKPQ